MIGCGALRSDPAIMDGLNVLSTSMYKLIINYRPLSINGEFHLPKFELPLIQYKHCNQLYKKIVYKKNE